jgi:hypothetical protein
MYPRVRVVVTAKLSHLLGLIPSSYACIRLSSGTHGPVNLGLWKLQWNSPSLALTLRGDLGVNEKISVIMALPLQ